MSKRLKDILPSLFAQSERWKLCLLTDWKDLIGNLQGKVLIERVEGDVLYLKVEHPVWAQELSLLVPMLKKKINDHLGKEYIKHIHFKCIQSKYVDGGTWGSRVEKRTVDKQLKPLDGEEQRILALLKPDGLQSVLSSYFMVCKKNQALKKEKKEKEEHDFYSKTGSGQGTIF